MAAGDRAAPNSYDLPGVPWICYFTEDGISLHGTYWHNDFGKTRSHGCVNLSVAAARWFYLWTLPGVPASQQSVFETSGTILDVI
jgi:lipoprotein-anchoring transpeptidase ErfK/SrfK